MSLIKCETHKKWNKSIIKTDGANADLFVVKDNDQTMVVKQIPLSIEEAEEIFRLLQESFTEPKSPSAIEFLVHHTLSKSSANSEIHKPFCQLTDWFICDRTQCQTFFVNKHLQDPDKSCVKKFPRCLYLVMEHCEGGSLRSFCLNRSLRMTENVYAIKGFAFQALVALHQLHGQKWIHGDFHAGNILLRKTTKQTVKVCVGNVSYQCNLFCNDMGKEFYEVCLTDFGVSRSCHVLNSEYKSYYQEAAKTYDLNVKDLRAFDVYKLIQSFRHLNKRTKIVALESFCVSLEDELKRQRIEFQVQETCWKQWKLYVSQRKEEIASRSQEEIVPTTVLQKRDFDSISLVELLEPPLSSSTTMMSESFRLPKSSSWFCLEQLIEKCFSEFIV